MAVGEQSGGLSEAKPAWRCDLPLEHRKASPITRTSGRQKRAQVANTEAKPKSPFPSPPYFKKLFFPEHELFEGKREGTGRNNSFYYYSYYDENGKRIKRSTGLVNEKKARAYVNRLIAEGKFKEAPRVNKNYTFKEFAEENHFWEYDKCPIVRDALARKGKYSKSNCKANGDCMRKHIYVVEWPHNSCLTLHRKQCKTNLWGLTDEIRNTNK